MTEKMTGPRTVADVYYQLPIPVHHIEPFGKMKNCVESAAIWYFFVCAHDMIHKIPQQITLTDEEDQQGNLNNLVRSICLAANIRPAQMFDPEIVARAFEEARDSKLNIHPRIASFIKSGGQTYASYDRDPDSHANTY